MYVAHLTLHDFRSYPSVDVALEPGPVAFLGSNGQGKTNLVEAVDYLSRLTSHRVAGDAPLVRSGADHAVVRAAVVKDGRQAVLEVEINPGRANRARVNRAALPRARDLVGLVRTVLFSPEDLALVKGDPSERRRFLDDLLVLRAPRLAGVRADYERALKQRNSLLRTAGGARRATAAYDAALGTLTVWDEQLAAHGAELLVARLDLVEALRPYVGKAYQTVAKGASRDDADIDYRPSVPVAELSGEPALNSMVEVRDEGAPSPVVEVRDEGAPRNHLDTDAVRRAFLTELTRRRHEELDRGLTLVGPHRDELLLTLGHGAGPDRRLPVRGYASHGESWSFALALRLASFDLLRAEGDDPVLILDDVFAELDVDRRQQLADLVGDAEQVLVTAAVAADVPESLTGSRFVVADGEVRPA